MEKFDHKFFYRRYKNKKIITSRYMKYLKISDSIKFFGKLINIIL
jgi:hypothetical protein